jgi:hypothetical protein
MTYLKFSRFSTLKEAKNEKQIIKRKDGKTVAFYGKLTLQAPLYSKYKYAAEGMCAGVGAGYIKNSFNKADFYIFVLNKDNDPIAFVLMNDKYSTAYIELICSKVKGGGSIALKAAEDLAQNMGFKLVRLSAIPQAEAFYYKKGYRAKANACDPREEEKLVGKPWNGFRYTKCLNEPKKSDQVVSKTATKPKPKPKPRAKPRAKPTTKPTTKPRARTARKETDIVPKYQKDPKRKLPPYHARAFKGKTKKGKDGQMYVSDGRRWKKKNGATNLIKKTKRVKIGVVPVKGKCHNAYEFTETENGKVKNKYHGYLTRYRTVKVPKNKISVA